MLILNNMNIKVKKLYDFLKSLCDNILNLQTYLCRIEEIDIEKKLVVIHCRGIVSPIKLTFEEIVDDVVVMSSLSPRHASWVGYYYGKSYNDFLSDKSHCNLSSSTRFSFKESEKRYRVISQNRGGSISYLDRMTNDLIISSALDILTSDNLIMKFDSIEACYIGILGGIFISKNMNKKICKSSEENQIRLVK